MDGYGGYRKQRKLTITRSGKLSSFAPAINAHSACFKRVSKKAGPSKEARGYLQPYTNNSSSQWYTLGVDLEKKVGFRRDIKKAHLIAQVGLMKR